MDNKTLLESLAKIGACRDAREWICEHGGTAAEVWQDCERGDWMAWWIAKQPKFNKTPAFYFALADCASLSLKYFEEKYPNDNRPKKAIEIVRLYARGRATREQLRAAAAAAAYAAADAADAYAAAYAAADAAADAADAAAAADAAYAAYAAADAADAYAAAAAADAAAAAAYAAAYAADAAARLKTLKKCADIFRKYFPVSLFE